MSSIFRLRSVTQIIGRGIPGCAEPVALPSGPPDGDELDQDSSGVVEIAMAIEANACNEQSL
ncbi:hypothetical protein V4F39_07715 [Aquincola sp. MAHUQ-54]|uniref:Uncharacterized protein n=1 Tax=Aquincola agrisoli TaxID=3119538 RepID=A0AAW9QBQ7_9BURK